MKITKNFTYEEFFYSATAAQKGIQNTPSSCDYARIVSNIYKMAFVLQLVRNVHRGVIRISSGFRCPALNSAVGGVSNSYHLHGRAVDLVDIDLNLLRQHLEEVRKLTFDPFNQEYIFKIVDEKTWLHVQFSPIIENYDLDNFIEVFYRTPLRKPCA